jgi:hypothetical protein
MHHRFLTLEELKESRLRWQAERPCSVLGKGIVESKLSILTYLSRLFMWYRVCHIYGVIFGATWFHMYDWGMIEMWVMIPCLRGAGSYHSPWEIDMSDVFFKNVRVLRRTTSGQRPTRDRRLNFFSHYEMHNTHPMSVYKSCLIFSCQVAKSRNTSSI